MINKFNNFITERVDDDTWDGDWEDIQQDIDNLTSNYSDYNSDIPFGEEEEEQDMDMDLDKDEDMEHLKYLLRTMFKNKGFDAVSITNDELDINIRCVLSFREKLSDVVSLFDMINKLKTDILPQYECEFDMWYNKQGQTLEFSFIFDSEEEQSQDEDESQDEDDGLSYNPPF